MVGPGGDACNPTDSSIPDRSREPLGELVGEADAFRKAVDRIPAIAKSDYPVLIAGERGTGKELVARNIHARSGRCSFAFVPVNCGQLPDTLLHDELFGHELGAFTDAHIRRLGLIAQAERGTLFLDEIEGLTPGAQVALLRVLQDGRVRPVGADVERSVDVRYLSATNAPITELLAKGAFRPDLYDRLAVLFIHLPPLRSRREDILPLARFFLAKYKPLDRPMLQLTPEAERALLSYSWPGNVRELKNAIIRGVTFALGNQIRVQDLELPGHYGDSLELPPDALSFNEWKALVERAYLVRLMRKHKGNITRAARSAAKDRSELGRLLKKYHLDPKDFSRPS